MLRRRVLLLSFLAATLTAVGGPWSPAVAQVTLPTGPGASEGGDVTGSAGPVAISLSLSSLGFGELDPGAASAPVALEVRNVGSAPATLSLAATPMTDATTGASIPAGRLGWSMSALGGTSPVGAGAEVRDFSLAPGGISRIYLTLQVPNGAEQYVPEGDYAGALTVTATEVGP